MNRCKMIDSEIDEHRQYITRTTGHEVKIVRRISGGPVALAELCTGFMTLWRCWMEGLCDGTRRFGSFERRICDRAVRGLILCRISAIQNQIHIGAQICVFSKDKFF